jgi:hypothetical protein
LGCAEGDPHCQPHGSGQSLHFEPGRHPGSRCKEQSPAPQMLLGALARGVDIA